MYLKAKKHLGQHFLIDTIAVNKVLAAIEEHCPKDRPLLEIGAGQGVLTRHLASLYPDFRAVEFDSDMTDYLGPIVGEELLITADFLTLEPEKIFDGETFSLAGNFPYNISSQIIFKMIDHVDFIPVMVGMFQKEMAERICATPGGKQNGIITVLAQAKYNAIKLFDVGPESFDPPPKVNSSVILLQRHENYDLPCDEKMFKSIVKLSFGQRRKKIRNTLKSMVKDTSDPIFQKRPEELSVEEFVNIVNRIKNE